MKRFLFSIVAIALLSLIVSSCASTKRDCQGVKHYKQKNGIYL